MTEQLRILMVCTANQCRSPLSEAIATKLLRELPEATAIVRSAGTEATVAIPATDTTILAGKKRGYNLEDHLSQPLTAELLQWATLTLGMERSHASEAYKLLPEAFPRVFLLKDASRRATSSPRPPDMSVDDYILGLSAGRQKLDLIGSRPTEEVADPVGRSVRIHRKTIDELEVNLSGLIRSIFPV